MCNTSYKQVLSDVKGLKIVHLNCQSLYNKLSQVELLFGLIDVLCLSGTWLHDSYHDCMLSLPGKKLFRWDRSNGDKHGVIKSRGGGLACYITSDLAANSVMLNDMCLTTPHIELQTIKLVRDSHKTRYILNIYRPPDGNMEMFFSVLEEMFNSHNLSNQDVCLLGDFNINYMKRNDPKTKKNITFARTYGLKQLINSHTRLNGFGGTCIDLIFTNTQYVSSFGVLHDIIGDHCPIYLCIKKPRETNKCKRILGRTYTADDKTLFQTLLINDSWDEFFSETDPNILWEMILLNRFGT